MTGWDGNPIANKCLNIYVDPHPIITVNTSDDGTIEWFSGNPLQNPSLRGIETTVVNWRISFEPAGIVGG